MKKFTSKGSATPMPKTGMKVSHPMKMTSTRGPKTGKGGRVQ